MFQQIIKGAGALADLPEKLREKGIQSVALFVTGSLAEYASDLLKTFDVCRVSPSSFVVTVNNATEAFQQFQTSGAKAVIAIGGGKVMDLAKTVLYQLARNGMPVPFFVAAPSIAGSGAEATHFAVLYDDKKKISVAHPDLKPQLVFLDPLLQHSLSGYQKAVSGMDVLAQAVESWWNVSATLSSRARSEEALHLWNGYFLKAVKNENTAALENLLWASYLAGAAIDETKSTGPHAMSYYLTAHYQVPHGHAVALFLPLFFYYNQPDKKLLALVNCETPDDAAHYIWQQMRAAGLGCTFSELGLDGSAFIDALLDDVNQERFANNPKPFDREKLKHLIQEKLL